MLNFKLVSRKHKGFTLIELVLWLSLFSILSISFFSFLNYTGNIIHIGDREDEILLNGRYGFEFIKNEISSADKIIPSHKIENLNFQYPNNIGFIILTITRNSRDNKYNYSTYYLKKDELIRISINKETPKYPKSQEFAGYNQVCTKVEDISKTKLNTQNKIIDLKLDMDWEDTKTRIFETRIFLRCPIDE